MRIEEPSQLFTPVSDTRPLMPAPPPVRLIAIDDVRLPALASAADSHDAFYVGLLQFERDTADAEAAIVYRAERWRLLFDLHETFPVRDDYRATQVAVPHFDDVVRLLTDAETPFEWQKGTAPGLEAILLQDPSGNWVRVEPIRAIP